ncbi:MAG: hypothetical protein ACRDP6_14740 [Actinoallomurus sp.]
MATQRNQTTTPAKKVEAKAEEAPYADQAAVLADDTRALAEDIRADLDKLTERINGFGDLTPGDSDGPTADGIRRLPAAVAEVQRTLQGLALAAADLSRQATA